MTLKVTALGKFSKISIMISMMNDIFSFRYMILLSLQSITETIFQIASGYFCRMNV